MRISYRQKLSLYFVVIFALFTTGVVIFQQSREVKFRTAAVIERLDAYARLVESTLSAHPNPASAADKAVALLPDRVRLTLIDRRGTVVYDNDTIADSPFENHADRPEIVRAARNGQGSDIRISASNRRKYLYYAIQTSNGFIRVALPYDIQMGESLKSDNLFLVYIAALFIATLLVIHFVANRFGRSIRQLNEFARTGGNPAVGGAMAFPDDELGAIGRQIVAHYDELNRSKKEAVQHREKLLQHVHSSGEGLCFFTPDRRAEFYNGLFIQYLTTIADDSTSDPERLFYDPAFGAVADFLAAPRAEGEAHFETVIGKQGKHFNIQVNTFEDGSFEIIIDDITAHEKTRLLKQEMTSNIAHELRTPVTSIRGYLEIALEQSPDSERARAFLTKAYRQTIVLSELIADMNMITKIEEAPASFVLEAVSLPQLLEGLKDDLSAGLEAKNITLRFDGLDRVTVHGNRNLLYSIFRNLTDNAIRYAGMDIEVVVSRYGGDADFHYLSFADTGVGIPDERHLNRLFERFYRVNEGRTRDTGGSGLGLSIVRNAIALHRGTIVVKNRPGGGLEFLFKLPRADRPASASRDKRH